MSPDQLGLDPARQIGFAHASVDPFRPQDLVVPPGLVSAPPACPETTHGTVEAAIFLQHVSSNAAGDILLVCGGCGYETVYRIVAGTFEPRPFRVYPDGFRPPRFGTAEAAAPPTPRAVASKQKAPAKGRLLSSADAAKQSGLSMATIRAALGAGRLRALKRDGVYKIQADALAEFMAARESG